MLTLSLSFSIHIDNIIAKAYRSLGLICRAMSVTCATDIKRTLHLTLIRSLVTYCCQIWRPYLIKESRTLEKLQRRASKYIMGYPSLDYKQRLLKLNLLPLTLWLELQDVLLFLHLIKFPPDNYNLSDFVHFSDSSTRSATAGKLVPSSLVIPRLNCTKHFYYCNNWIIRIWNTLPPFDLHLSYVTLKTKLKDFFWDYFLNNYCSDNPHSWYCVCPCSSCSVLPIHTNYI